MSEPKEHPQTQPPPLPAAPPIETSEHAEVLAELEKLQANKPGWGGAIWVLVGSVVLFFAALNIGSIQLPILHKLDSSLSGVLQGMLVLFVLLAEGVRQRFTSKA